MEAKRFGNWIILWRVYEYDEEDIRTRTLFKDPNKAAEYALKNKCGGVEMILYRETWPIKTMD